MLRAATAVRLDAEDPASAVDVRSDLPRPTAADGWEVVEVRAAALNHHDLWNLRGMGAIRDDQLPIVLGSDGAGVTTEGRPVVVHAVISPPAHGMDETLTPGMSLLSDRYDGTLADQVAVPSSNLVDKPDGLSYQEAACLPTAYLTAFRMLFTKAALTPGQRVLIQGSGGGLPTAAILLARAAGVHVTVTSRDEQKLERALDLGADVAVPTGERLPRRVHAVLDIVGEATWAHSLGALLPGGILVVSGATSGGHAVTDLRRVYFRQLRIAGSTMGSRDELARLVAFVSEQEIRPQISEVLDLDETPNAVRRMEAGDVFGKLVVTP